MKIALCNGGLGNQTFQYIFSRFIELAGGVECYLDDSEFFQTIPSHNGFEMQAVFPNCRPRLLSSYFSGDVWEYMVQKSEEGYQSRSSGKMRERSLPWWRRRPTFGMTGMW